MNYTDYLQLNERSIPDQTAVRTPTDSWSYEDLAEDVSRFANVLRDDEVAPDDNTAVMLPNSYNFVVALFGMLANKNQTGLIDPRMKGSELGSQIEKMEPTAVVTSAANAEEIRSLDANVTIYCPDEDVSVARDFWGAIERTESKYRIPETLSERDALVLHTSGSTGEPKAVVHTHHNFIAVSDLAAVSYQLHTDTTYLAALPLYHCWGLMNLGAILKVGGEIVLLEEWDPEAAIERFDEYEVDFFAGVPTMYKDIMAASPDAWAPSTLELAITGGAGVPRNLISEAEAVLECSVLNGWGMTETFAAGVWEEQSQERRIPSVGKEKDRLFEVKVVDQQSGEELPPDEAGELLIRGEAVMERYLDDPAATDEVFTGEWFHTGDIARIDEDGFVYLQDRAKYMIITGGENIYPQEVEDVIDELDGVRNSIVVAKPDERKGEKPVAFVERTPPSDVTEDDVKSHCLDRLAAYKHPREVFFVETFPRNSVGKVDRNFLEDRVTE